MFHLTSGTRHADIGNHKPWQRERGSILCAKNCTDEVVIKLIGSLLGGLRNDVIEG
jgi:hypothetical protein